VGERKFYGWKDDVSPSIPLRERVSGRWWKVKAVYVNPLSEVIKTQDFAGELRFGQYATCLKYAGKMEV
jgi:hypothetical protein